MELTIPSTSLILPSLQLCPWVHLLTYCLNFYRQISQLYQDCHRNIFLYVTTRDNTALPKYVDQKIFWYPVYTGSIKSDDCCYSLTKSVLQWRYIVFTCVFLHFKFCFSFPSLILKLNGSHKRLLIISNESRKALWWKQYLY